MRKYFQYSLIYLPEGWYSCCWRRRCPPPCPTWRAAPCPGRRRPWRPPWAWLEEWGGVSWWGAGLMLSLWREEEQESTESHHMVSSVQLQPSTHSLSQDALSPPAHMSQSHSHTVTFHWWRRSSYFRCIDWVKWMMLTAVTSSLSDMMEVLSVYQGGVSGMYRHLLLCDPLPLSH